MHKGIGRASTASRPTGFGRQKWKNEPTGLNSARPAGLQEAAVAAAKPAAAELKVSACAPGRRQPRPGR